MTSIDLSVDGKTLVSSSSDGTARLWDLESQALTRVLDTIEKRRVVSAAFSSDGKFVATGGVAMTVRLWRCADGASVILGSHRDRIHVVRFLSSGAGVLAADASGSARVWKIPVDFLNGAPGSQVATDAAAEAKGYALPLLAWHGHAGRVFGLAISPDGKHVATAGADGTLRITDLDASAIEGGLRLPLAGNQFRFGSADDLLTWYTQPPIDRPPCRHVLIHDLAHQTMETIASPIPQAIITAALSPDGRTVVLGHVQGHVTIVERAAGAVPEVIDLHSPNNVDCLQFLPDGRTLIVQIGFDPDGVRFLETGTWRRLEGYPQQQVLGRFHLSASAKRLVTHNSRWAYLCDFSQMPAILRTFEHSEGIMDAELSPDETLLAASCDDRKIKLWDAASGQLRGELIGHTQQFLGVRFSPDGATLFSHGPEEAIKVWHVPSRLFLFDLTGQAQAVGFSPSGKYLAYAHADGGVFVHDLEALRQDGKQSAAK